MLADVWGSSLLLVSTLAVKRNRLEQHLFEGETVCVPYVVQGRRQLSRSWGGGGELSL